MILYDSYDTIWFLEYYIIHRILYDSNDTIGFYITLRILYDSI